MEKYLFVLVDINVETSEFDSYSEAKEAFEKAKKHQINHHFVSKATEGYCDIFEVCSETEFTLAVAAEDSCVAGFLAKKPETLLEKIAFKAKVAKCATTCTVYNYYAYDTAMSVLGEIAEMAEDNDTSAEEATPDAIKDQRKSRVENFVRFVAKDQSLMEHPAGFSGSGSYTYKDALDDEQTIADAVEWVLNNEDHLKDPDDMAAREIYAMVVDSFICSFMEHSQGVDYGESAYEYQKRYKTYR